MHPLAAGAVTGSVIKRVSQGDCPTEPAHSVETLEEALIEVNRLFQTEQKVRERAEKALRHMLAVFGQDGLGDGAEGDAVAEAHAYFKATTQRESHEYHR